MNICVFGASSDTIDKIYITMTEELCEKMAKKGHGLVFGGGARGVMGASARGEKKGGGKIIGVVPSFFKVDGTIYEECDEYIYTETMRERKGIMEERADAFIIAPGGIGTYEEFFEVFTLKQLARHNKPIVIFNINGYYDAIISALETAEKENFIRPMTMSLFEVYDTADEVLDYIENYVPQKIDIVKTRGLDQ